MTDNQIYAFGAYQKKEKIKSGVGLSGNIIKYWKPIKYKVKRGFLFLKLLLPAKVFIV
jgi:hypothetical protein